MNAVQANEPWLDTRPTDWRPSRIRNAARLSPSYSDGPPTADELCTVVPMEFLSESGAIDVTSAQPFADVNGGLTLFEQGDVIFAKITPCMENGKGAFVGMLPTRYAFGSTEFHVLRANCAVDPRFLYYYHVQLGISRVCSREHVWRSWAEASLFPFFEGHAALSAAASGAGADCGISGRESCVN